MKTSGITTRPTFGRWKREKIEERRIETAIEALALAYESQIVFLDIRSAFVSDFEYKDMPVRAGESQEERSARGTYWVYGKRLRDNKDFFVRAWKLQPVMMAVFGEQMAAVLKKLHEVRAAIQVASEALADDVTAAGDRTRALQLRTDLIGWTADNREIDRVQQDLDAFRKRIESVCKPVVDSEARKHL